MKRSCGRRGCGVALQISDLTCSSYNIRFIQISGDHLRGTGNRNYVLGFQCADGNVKNIFEQEGEGLMLVSATSDIVQVSSPVWKSSDAHCCPSEEKKTWFSWDKVSGGYVEKDSTKTSAP